MTAIDPKLKFVVQSHGEHDAVFFYCLFYIVYVVLKFKLWCVDTKNNKPFMLIFFIPRFYMRNGADAVVTGVCPEIDKYHLTL